MHTIAHYVHHLDPYIFKIGPFGPRYYGVAYLLGFLFAYLLLKKQSRDGMLRLQPQLVPDFVLSACIVGVLVGGRLGYVLFYDLPAALKAGATPLLWNFSSAFPFWGVLKVWDGGMAAHGGVVFTILFLIWYGRRHKVSVINLGDASCMVVPIGLFFGRVANFINGELYGHPTTVPWAVKFPSEVYAPTNDKPSLTPEQMADLKQSVANYILDHSDKLSLQQVQDFLAHHPEVAQSLGKSLGTLNLEGSAVQLAEAQRTIALYLNSLPFGLDNVPGFEQLSRWDIATWWQGERNGLTSFMEGWFRDHLPARHPSQLYQALLEGLLLFIVCYLIGRRWKKDGMASGAFLTLYPVMRIIGEQFRVGDTAVTGQLSAGVLYSLPMFVVGAIYWAYFIRKSKPNVWVPHTEAPPAAKT
jgi:phosphatidylglycerol---prolipoprotein diacylglyceryl transferase